MPLAGVVWWLLRVCLTAALLTIAAVHLLAPDASSPTQDGEPVLRGSGDRTGTLQIVAMGDSYMSGEGAGAFFAGTDRGGKNHCRRAPTAYPLRVARSLAADIPDGYRGVHLSFVACSGAITSNIGDAFEDPDTKPTRQFATQPLQITALEHHAGADVVLLGIGGNDAGFSNIVLTCSGRQRGCEELAGPWLARLDPIADEQAVHRRDHTAYVQASLRDVMRRIREVAPGALAYVTTYPNPLSAPSCPAIGMDEGESRFLTHVFLPRLNDEIKLAAGLEGFEVIDLFDVFEHSGLCAEGPHRNGPAMNPWRFQNIDRLVAGPDDYLRGSMHPTAAGHALIAKKVEATVRHDLQRQRVPPSEPPSPPGSPSAADVPGSPPPTGAPPTGPPPIDVPPPEGPWTLRTNPCVRKAQRNENVVRPDGPLRVTGAKPGSPVCVAGFAQPFTRGTADTEGTFVVTTPRAVSGIGGRREAIYQRPDGTWVWRIEWAKPGTPDSGLSAFQAWLWRPWQLSLVALIAIVLVIATLVEHLVRKALNAMLDG